MTYPGSATVTFEIIYDNFTFENYRFSSNHVLFSIYSWNYKDSFHAGVICKIDDRGIDVSFDTATSYWKKYALDCKDEIVLDNQAQSKELVPGTPVLARLVRRRAFYKGEPLLTLYELTYCSVVCLIFMLMSSVT